MQTLTDFFQGYWEFARYYVLGLVAAFLLLAFIIRRGRIAFFILTVGLFLSLAYYFMNQYERLGIELFAALGIMLGGGLMVAVVIYYFVFVRD